MRGRKQGGNGIRTEYWKVKRKCKTGRLRKKRKVRRKMNQGRKEERKRWRKVGWTEGRRGETKFRKWEKLIN